jgi:parallel beta-helix repeat protein
MKSSKRREYAALVQFSRVCVGACISASLVGCGGGEGNASSSTAVGAGPVPQDGGAAHAQSVVVAANGLMSDADARWVLAQPTKTVLAQGPATVPTESPGRTTYYVESAWNSTLPASTVRTGLSSNAAFGSIADLLAKVTTFKPGDAILLRCGSVFREQLTLDYRTAQFQNANNMLVGVYPSDCTDGQLPVLRGSKVPSLQWAADSTDTSGMIKKAALAQAPTRVFGDTVPLMAARFPNEQAEGVGRFANATVVGVSDTKSHFKVKDADRASIGDIVGANIYVRINPFTVEKRTVTSYVDGLITLSSALSDDVKESTGYILEATKIEHKWMLDKDKEWLYAGGYLYFYGTPSAIEVSDQSYGVKVSDAVGLRIERLKTTQQEFAGIEVNNSASVVITDVESSYAGAIGIGGVTDGAKPTTGLQVLNSRVIGAGTYGIMAGAATGTIVSNSYVYGTAMAAIMPTTIDPWKQSIAAAIRIAGVGSKADGNYIVDSASPAVFFNDSESIVVSNNTIVRPCLLLSDCGGIYTRGSSFPSEGPVNGAYVAPPARRTDDTKKAQIIGNVIMGVKANVDGAFTTGAYKNLKAGQDAGYGIYLDDYANNVVVSNNLISNAEVGIYLHNAMWNRVDGNQVRGVRHASLEANFDYVAAQCEVMRGNTVTNNLFFSRRAVDPSAFGQESATSIENGAPQVYAELWQSKNDPANFFKPFTNETNNAACTAEPQPTPNFYLNRSAGNRTLTLTKVESPALWRMDRFGNLGQASGAVWGLRQADLLKEIGMGDWLGTVPAPQTGYVADKEESPLSYAPYIANLVNESTPLVGDFLVSGQWLPRDGTLTPLTDRVQFLAAQSWAMLTSAYFPITQDQFYLTRFTATAGDEPARFAMNIYEKDNYSTGATLTKGSFIPPTAFKANESKRIEHFFRAQVNAPFVGVFLKPTDANDTRLTKVMYFNAGSVLPVSGFDVLPALRTLSVSVVNAASADRVLSCADLGFSDQCSLLADEENKPLTWSSALLVKPRTAVQLYVRDTKWLHN